MITPGQAGFRATLFTTPLASSSVALRRAAAPCRSKQSLDPEAEMSLQGSGTWDLGLAMLSVWPPRPPNFEVASKRRSLSFKLRCLAAWTSESMAPPVGQQLAVPRQMGVLTADLPRPLLPALLPCSLEP